MLLLLILLSSTASALHIGAGLHGKVLNHMQNTVYPIRTADTVPIVKKAQELANDQDPFFKKNCGDLYSKTKFLNLFVKNEFSSEMKLDYEYVQYGTTLDYP